METWMSTNFQTAKLAELQEAKANVPMFFTHDELAEYTPLGNNVKKAYLQVGILKNSDNKRGKQSLLTFGELSVEKIREAYRLREELTYGTKTTEVVTIKPATKEEEDDDHGAHLVNKWSTRYKVVDTQEVKATVETPETKVETVVTNTAFPSIEDCIAYLKHAYSLNVEVVLMPKGYHLEDYKITKD